ncbi:MAG: YgeY family selenium metabolism-linked hydrolase [Lachnospiraceae bacterium]|jgi:putative selenium metabolism hydrolase|nr:YgeY family selenium metabolism-linked hydrolase [Lachnospiraceae bacterium]
MGSYGKIALTHEDEETVIRICQDLIRAKGGSGHEEAAGQVLVSYYRQLGYDEALIDDYGNAVGVINGNRPGKCLVFDGHIDTVQAVESQWSVDPFGGVRKDGRIYGRGTSDMKGAIAAFTLAAPVFARACGRDFHGKIVVAGTVQEEAYEGVASVGINDAYHPDLVIIGEASDMNLKIGQRGRAEILVETIGTTAHSAHPERGNNAILAMCKVIDAIGRIPTPEDPKLHKGIMVLTDIISEPFPAKSCVPYRCLATYDRRLLKGETRESVLAPISEALAALEAADPTVRTKVSYAHETSRCYTGKTISSEKFFPAWLFEESEGFVQTALAGLRADGFDPLLSVYDFCTNGSLYAGELGIPTLGFGPSREDLAHSVDEYIEIGELTKAAACYVSVLGALTK